MTCQKLIWSEHDNMLNVNLVFYSDNFGAIQDPKNAGVLQLDGPS